MLWVVRARRYSDFVLRSLTSLVILDLTQMRHSYAKNLIIDFTGLNPRLVIFVLPSGPEAFLRVIANLQLTSDQCHPVGL